MAPLAALSGGAVQPNDQNVYINLMMNMFSNFNEPSSIPVSAPAAEPKEKKKRSKPQRNGGKVDASVEGQLKRQRVEADEAILVQPRASAVKDL